MNVELPVWNEAESFRRALRLIAPQTPNQLHAYIRAVLGFHMPRTAMVSHHNAPFDYLLHSFFEDSSPQRDCIVWANRGGGKTQLGAIATLLDLLFKPGIEIRILGGSFDQSSKMYRYLKRLLELELFSDLIAGNLTARHVELTNGSRVEVLSQSEHAVRGQRVHKLRCDEVELFDPDVWEAAQLVTRSGRCGKVHVRAAIEALSTMHRPYGLMNKLVRESTLMTGAESTDRSAMSDETALPTLASPRRRKLFRWSVLDTLRHCPPQRLCSSCSLWDECQGRAKLPQVRGFISIDDALQQKSRISAETWHAEMLCERPNRSDTVYPEFQLHAHVYDETHDAHSIAHTKSHALLHVAGIDFGFRCPTVLLLGFIQESPDSQHNQVLHIVDELTCTETITTKVIELAEARCKKYIGGLPCWIGADPAGHQRSEHTGASTISVWKKAGWNVRTRVLPIEVGVRAVKSRLRRADGFVGLRIHRRCQQLIEALTVYRYPHGERLDSAKPIKDGHDHAADALRYLIINLDRSPTTCREY